MNIAAELDRIARDRGERPALHSGDQVWTFADLDARASAVATGLESAGVRPGDRVVIVMGNEPDHVAAWYGITKAGALPVDLNILLGDEEWTAILDDCAPRAVLAGGEFVPRLRGLLDRDAAVQLWATGDAAGALPLAGLGAGTPARPAIARNGREPAVIAYTSGTTGRPKGVVHDHDRLRHHLDVCVEALGYGPDDVIVNLLPLFPLHAFLAQAGLCVHVGCQLVLLGRFDPAVLADESRRHRFTTGTFVPAIVQALLAVPPEARPRFVPGSRFNIGGAPLSPETRERFESTYGVTLLQGYGSTEVMGSIAMERAGRRPPWGACGELFPRLEGLVRVVDEHGRDVEPGTVGEFAVHASRALVGYWGDEAATREAFLDGEWYRMGDLGRIDENGFVAVVDRCKDMIIRGGFNIYSAEIERVLSEHRAVAEATVVGQPDERLGEVPVAYVVTRPAVTAGPALGEELRRTVAERLGPLKVVERVEFVAASDLPRNAMGKVLKRELRARLVRAG
ncbi:MAG: AMP-binding protein [Actinomycetota bacterium]|jgi:long-chain acyl-CoA synthetase